MSEPDFERPDLSADELHTAYENIAGLDQQLEELTEKRETLLGEVRASISNSSIPEEAKLLALALKGNRISQDLEYLRGVDGAIREHGGDLVGRICYEGVSIPDTNSERILLVLTLGRLPNKASLIVDSRGEAAAPVEKAVKIHFASEIKPGKTGHWDAIVSAALFPVWKDRNLEDSIIQSDVESIRLPQSRTSGDALIVGQEEIRQALLSHLDPTNPNEAVLASAFASLQDS